MMLSFSIFLPVFIIYNQRSLGDVNNVDGNACTGFHLTSAQTILTFSIMRSLLRESRSTCVVNRVLPETLKGRKRKGKRPVESEMGVACIKIFERSVLIIR